MIDLTALIQDLEANGGPSWRLDKCIWYIIDPAMEDYPFRRAPNYTGDLSIARSLFGPRRYTMTPLQGKWQAWIAMQDNNYAIGHSGCANTEPLALCAAALRLKQQEG
jgi:hypothetical protein